jgi:hypothetical protein
VYVVGDVIYIYIYIVNKTQFKTLSYNKPLTEMSTKNIKIIMFLGSKVRWVRRAVKLTTISETIA